jgi:hypothetical protein
MVILGVSVLVMLIDLGIKNQILVESYRLRAEIGNENDRRTESTGHVRSAGNGAGNPDVLGKYPTGMETGAVPDKSPEFPTGPVARQTKPRPADRDREIPE